MRVIQGESNPAKKRKKANNGPKYESLSGFELIFFSLYNVVNTLSKETRKIEREKTKHLTQNKQFINTCNECFDESNLPL